MLRHLLRLASLLALALPSATLRAPGAPPRLRPNELQSTARPAVLGRLAVVGATVGPLVDAVHNQALLSYDVLPLAIGPVTTSAPIPLLLGLTYALLGGAIPAALDGLAPATSKPLFPPLLGLRPGSSALAAVGTTVAIIKASELLELSHVAGATGLLYLACALQWALIDATPGSVAFALIVSIGGPLAELPFTWLGLWHYLPPVQDYWPLSAFGADAASGRAWAGLAHITAPCYFAVTTDAIALGRWFASTACEQETPSAGTE